MKRLREILRTATLGGVLVVLPTLLLVWIVVWLAQLLGTELAPIAAWLASIFALPDVIAVGAAFGLVVGICFAIGLVVQTDSGAQMVHLLETHLMMRIPGYRTLKDVVQQIGARDERLFSEAVLVRFEDMRIMGFITERDAAGVTVFVPTSPNPTTGLVLHLPEERVIPLSVPAHEVFKSVISCGVNSRRLLDDDAAHGNA